MKKGFLLIAALFVVVSCSSTQKSPTNPTKVISNNQLERVDQTIEEFPAPLQQLGLDLHASKYPEVYSSLKTDREKFTLVSLAEQVVNKVNDEKVRKDFEPFFLEASKSGFDWTKAVAIRGLGQTADMGQMHYLIKFLDDVNPTVVDETLVALKFIFDRQEVETTRAPASNKENVYEIKDVTYWKKWAKNN